MASFPGASSLVLLALLAAAAAVDAHNYKMVFKVEDCHGKPVQDAEVKVWGCVKDTKTVKANKDGLAIFHKEVQYCDLPHSEKLCHWSATKDGDEFASSDTTLLSKPHWWSWSKSKQCSPKELSGCDCKSKCYQRKADAGYHKAIVLKQKTCKPVDCKGEWTTVGCKDCSATCEKPEGHSERMFKVITEAKNGGKACQHKCGYTEKVPCHLKDYSKCAEDCEGYWKITKACDATCTKHGKREETFMVTKPAAYGGKCPNQGKKKTVTCELTAEQRHAKCKVDCKGKWTSVGCKACSATCEKPEGYSERMFKIITEAKNGGKACQHKCGYKEKVPCHLKDYSKCAKDCEGYWKITKACNATCTKHGKREETFIVTKPAVHGGKCPNQDKKKTVTCQLTSEQRHAKCKVDCKGEWTTVGCKGCSATCEKPEGHYERIFKIITQAKNGGKACQHKDGYKEHVPCHLKDYSKCRVDCVGDWTVTKKCTATCDHPKGYFERTSKVTTPAKNGGKPCQYKDGFVDREPCHLKDYSQCPKDCKGDYKKVVPCNATCAHPEGVIENHFVITQQPANGGKPCPLPVEYKPCKLNEYEREDCKVDCDGKYEIIQKCNATCDHPSGTIVKKFKVTQEPKYGGAACPEEYKYECCGLKQHEAEKCIKDCKGYYQLYKACNASCENPEGVIIKKFIVTQQPTAGGKQCQPLEEIKPCSLKPSDLEDCKVDCQGYYKKIERCNATCEHPDGVEVRKFIIKQEPKFGGKACPPELEYKTCSLREWELEKCKRDCKGYWKKIQPCNATCGSSGFKVERFEVICPPQYGGKPCDYTDGEEKYIPCEKKKPCGEDCVGEFVWGDCSATCCGTTGYQFKIFKVLKNKTYSGEDCKHKDGEKVLSDKTCSADPCPKDCEGYYTVEQECNSTCAHPEGVLIKKFIVTQQPDPNGKPCPPLELYKPCRLEDYQSCKKNCCGEYEVTTNCTATCANPKGVIVKKFKVTQQPEYGGAACPGDLVEECSLTYEEIEDCKVDCLGEYETVKNCTANCDKPTGVIIQKFKVTQEPQYGGAACPKDKNITQCYLSQEEKDKCKRNCTGEYKVVKNCTATCDHPKGYTFEEFVVSTNPAYGGEECPKDRITECELTEYELSKCKEDCEGYWAVVKNCTADCYNHEGVIVEKFIVTKPAQYGGYCPDEKNITKCYLAPEEKEKCKVNCTGYYEVVKNCTATCDDPYGYYVEHFVITTPPAYGGAECPKDRTIDCTLTYEQKQNCSVPCIGEYETVKNCTATCADPIGVIVQKFKVTQEPQYSGAACPEEKIITQCYLSQEELEGCKEDCEGYWKTVKNCTADCYKHEGVIVEKFIVTKPAQYGGYCPDKNVTKCYLSQEEQDKCKVNCTGDYVVTKNCTATCEHPYGYQVEHFVIATPPAYGGAECPKDRTTDCTLTDEQKQNCSVPCLGEYETVKDCSATCDNPSGVIIQKFKVTQEPQYGGAACPKKINVTQCYLSQEELEGCKVNCTGKYDVIHNCTASCDKPEGYIVRKFIVEQPPKYGGAECPPEIIKDECYLPEEELKECNKDCEGNFTVICSAKDCYSEGWEFKVFHVTQNKTGKGKECLFKDGQKIPLLKTCRKPGCPTDCKGEWKNTNNCSAVACGTKGYYYDVFHVTQNKIDGGKDCPYAEGYQKEDRQRCCYGPPCPRDCKGYWVEVKPCNATCGAQGYKTEKFVISCPATAGGKPCNYTQHELRYVPCTRGKPCGKDCIGDFVLTEKCSADQCGTNGTLYKVFHITQNKTAGGCNCTYQEGYEIPSDVPCSAKECPKDCIGEWKPTDICNTTECGTSGFKLEQFHIIQNKTYGGKECDYAEGATRPDEKCPCTNDECPKDCIGEWKPTDICNTTECGTSGFKLEQFHIIQNKTYGGKECDYAEGATRPDEKSPCTNEECPKDCIGEWKPTDICNTTECGTSGVKLEQFHIIQNKTYGGKECDYAEGATRPDEKCPCTNEECPKDCTGEWDDTNKCNATTCGTTGFYLEVFKVYQNKNAGGKDCPAANGDTRPDLTRPCSAPACCPACKSRVYITEGPTEGLVTDPNSNPQARKMLTFDPVYRTVDVAGKCSGSSYQCPADYPTLTSTKCTEVSCGKCCIPQAVNCQFKLEVQPCSTDCGKASKVKAKVVIITQETEGGKKCRYNGQYVSNGDTVTTSKDCEVTPCPTVCPSSCSIIANDKGKVYQFNGMCSTKLGSYSNTTCPDGYINSGEPCKQGADCGVCCISRENACDSKYNPPQGKAGCKNPNTKCLCFEGESADCHRATFPPAYNGNVGVGGGCQEKGCNALYKKLSNGKKGGACCPAPCN